jgi:hypothetical protein
MIRSQNNFASYPTHVRVVVHLQDVRILAVGVLSSEPTLFTNPNAHRLLHPPLLRDTTKQIDTPPPSPSIPHTIINSRTPLAAYNESANSNEAYFPLVRTLSPSTPGATSYGLGEGYLAPTTSRGAGPSSPSLASTIAWVLPSRRRRNTEETGRGLLNRTRSREAAPPAEEGRRRSWALGRSRTGSTSNTLDRTISGEGVIATSPAMPAVQEQSPTIVDTPTIPNLPSNEISAPISTSLSTKPYPIIRKPLPAAGYANYPNYTPITDPEDKIRDTRCQYPEIEDNATGQIWASEEPTSKEDIRLVEWSEQRGRRERWVGPMM